MKKLPIILLLSFISLPVFSQNEVGVFTILMGGSVGKFNVDGGGNFNTIYSDRQLAYTGMFGLGSGETFIVAKYRMFNASGQSQLSNSTATGKAEWKQKILLTGFRVHPKGSALYFDVLYVFNRAEESIGTKNPPVDVLSASQRLDDNGGAFALGLAPRIAGPLALDLEAEYSFMLRKSSNDSGRRIPNLGGLYYGAGISFYFNN